jgi:hypothetical protein
MKIGVFTLYEGSYHKGVAALANSLIRAGFAGPFFAGYRDSIPDWARRIGVSAEQRANAHGLDDKRRPWRAVSPDAETKRPLGCAGILRQV